MDLKSILFFGLFLLIFISEKSFSKTEILPIDFDLKNIPSRKAVPPEVLLGQTITVDTRSQKDCVRLRQDLDPQDQDPQLLHLCESDSQRPFATIVILRTLPKVQKAEWELNSRTIQHINNTRNVLLLNAIFVGRFLHKSKNWRDFKGQSIEQRWADNVFEKGPHWDQDNWKTNYIAHPIAGATSYAIARHSGFNQWESFGFSVFASTFLWEFGMEGVFQQPSINDLIVTPIIGTLIGELFYQIDESIKKSDGRVLGSPALGTVIRLISNPGYYVTEGFNEVLGRDWFKEGSFGVIVADRKNKDQFIPFSPTKSSAAILMQLKLKF